MPVPPVDLKAPVNLKALILAGGQSRRMGQDKALIPIGGIPLLRRICQVALTCTPSVYVITPWPQRYRAILPEDCQLLHEVALPSAQSVAHGPLVGFAQGFAQIDTDWLLLLACDLPQLQGEILQDWVSQLVHLDQPIQEQHSPAGQAQRAIALLPRGPKGWEPLCGFYHRSCLGSLTTFIQAHGRSFQTWLAQHPVQPLAKVDGNVLLNCNTPADLAKVNLTAVDLTEV